MEIGRNGGSVRDPNIWGKLIDRGLRKGISRATSEQLLKNVSLNSKTTCALAATLTLMTASVDLGGLDIENLVREGIFWSATQQGFNAIVNQILGNSFTDRRLSLIPGYQLDRLVAAKGLIRARKLVKPIN